MTPARRNRERKLAALNGAANPKFEQQHANAYELQLMQLAEHRRTLKGHPEHRAQDRRQAHHAAGLQALD